jgi:hypothetical protein
VVGLTASKVHVQLDDPPIDLKVYVRPLGVALGRPLRVDRLGLSLSDATGATICRLGDEVLLEVDAYDPDRKRWNFRLRRPGGPAPG